MTEFSARSALAVAAVLLVVVSISSCGSDDATSSPEPGGSTTASTSEPGTTSVDDTAVDTAADDTAADEPAALFVEELLETRPAGPVSVRGMLIDEGAGVLLCEALAESFPPQCGGRWVVVMHPDLGQLDVVSEGGVRWVDQPVTLEGQLEADRFVVGDPSEVAPTAEDLRVVEALVQFARSPSTTTLGEVPISATGIELGLADQLLTVRTETALSDPSSWSVDLEAFRGWVGPFSALGLLAQDRPTEVLLGPHNHCASPPVRVPADVAGLRHVSVSPTDATSCLEWWTVDLFLDDDGSVAAVTLDLWEP
jgi:hypothetical protein